MRPILRSHETYLSALESYLSQVFIRNRPHGGTRACRLLSAARSCWPPPARSPPVGGHLDSKPLNVSNHYVL
jgi:hypothetical protein